MTIDRIHAKVRQEMLFESETGHQIEIRRKNKTVGAVLILRGRVRRFLPANEHENCQKEYQQDRDDTCVYDLAPHIQRQVAEETGNRRNSDCDEEEAPSKSVCGFNDRNQRHNQE